jgi:hypothetical protein
MVSQRESRWLSHLLKGSIMNRTRNLSPAFFTAVALVAAVGFHPTSQAIAQTAAAPKEAAGLADPCEVKGQRNWRGNAFYEILFMNRDAKGAGGIGNYYNSIGNSFDVSNEVLDARFQALDPEKLKHQYGSDGVRFNGPRRFVANGFSGIAFDGCKTRVIGGIPFTLYGTFAAPSFDAFMTGKETPYHVLVSRRTNTFYFNAGEQVHELVTPEGEVYTMFSLSLRVDPNNTLENLPTLAKRLTLPTGWTYRVRTLDKDLALASTYDANPPNSIVLDQLENNYQHNTVQK